MQVYSMDLPRKRDLTQNRNLHEFALTQNKHLLPYLFLSVRRSDSTRDKEMASTRRFYNSISLGRVAISDLGWVCSASGKSHWTRSEGTGTFIDAVGYENVKLKVPFASKGERVVPQDSQGVEPTGQANPGNRASSAKR
jgi:hypothetical protein